MTTSSRSAGTNHPNSSGPGLRVVQVERDYNVNSGSGIFIVNNRTKFIQGARSIRLHIQGTEEEEEEYDQYFEYRRSDIRLLRKIHHEKVWDLRLCVQIDCERSVWLAEILSGDGKGRIVTVVSYQGQDAPEIWKTTFRDSTTQLCADNAHLLGINRSKIPLLILLGELVPAATLADNIGELSQWYLSSLRSHWGCKREELWIDNARGVICRGPEGPEPYLFGEDFGLDGLVVTTDLLKEDTLTRYLANLKAKRTDLALVKCISYGRDDPDDDDDDVGMSRSVDQPTVFRNLDNTTIAVANQTWASIRESLVERELLENGQFRFLFTEGDESFSLHLNHDIGEVWISQALSIFHSCGIALEESLRDCTLVVPQATLVGRPYKSESKRRLPLKQPIYLFVRLPHPSSYSAASFQYISSFHWSFQESGDPPLPLEICDSLGLPIELEFSGISYSSMSWTAAQYKMLRQYKVLRGFDPNTTAFAQHVGFNDCVFTPIIDSDQIEVVYEGYPTSHECSADTLKHPATVQRNQNEVLAPSPSRCNSNIDVVLVHVECRPTILDHGPNKHQETGPREGGKEHRRIYVERSDLRRSNDINKEQKTERTSIIQQSDRLFYASSPPLFMDIPFASPTSSFHPQNITLQGMPQHVLAASFHDPVSTWHTSTSDPEIASFNGNPSTSTMNDRDSAYADPAGYVVDTTTPITSAINDTGSAYAADPSIYIVNTTTFDRCHSEAIMPPSMRSHGLHTTDMNSRPGEDMSQRIGDTVDHQGCPSEKEHEDLLHSRPSHLSSRISRAAEKGKPDTPTEYAQIIQIDTL
ncbi:hypothetical protein PQX77_003667, partial [Marasmius sp. AFHP31]